MSNSLLVLVGNELSSLQLDFSVNGYSKFTIYYTRYSMRNVMYNKKMALLL